MRSVKRYIKTCDDLSVSLIRYVNTEFSIKTFKS